MSRLVSSRGENELWIYVGADQCGIIGRRRYNGSDACGLKQPCRFTNVMDMKKLIVTLLSQCSGGEIYM
jgi:hypothetical protein